MLKNKVLKVIAVAIIITTLCSGFASAFDFSDTFLGQFVVNTLANGFATGTDTDVDFATGTDTDVDFATGTDTDVDFATGTDTDVDFATGTDTDVDFATGTDTDSDDAEEETCIFKKIPCIICKILMFIFDLLNF